MKKKTKVIIIACVIAVLLLVITAGILVFKLLTHKKDPVTIDEFAAYAQEQGYSFKEYEENLPEGVSRQGVAVAEVDGQEISITFSQCEELAVAVKLFMAGKSMIINDYKTNVSSNMNIELMNNARYEQNSGGVFGVAARVEDTVLLTVVSSEAKTAVRDFVNGLGY